jgi:hypothetical protein
MPTFDASTFGSRTFGAPRAPTSRMPTDFGVDASFVQYYDPNGIAMPPFAHPPLTQAQMELNNTELLLKEKKNLLQRLREEDDQLQVRIKTLNDEIDALNEKKKKGGRKSRKPKGKKPKGKKPKSKKTQKTRR